MKNCNLEFSETEVFVGIDVAKDSLAVFVSQGTKDLEFENTGIDHRKIVRLCRRLDPTRICLEATGGYQTELMLVLAEAGLPASMTNPKQVRDFAKGQGYLYKNDRIDAKMLAFFGQQVKPRLTVLPSKEVRDMSALSRRREQIIKMLTSEKNRLPWLTKRYVASCGAISGNLNLVWQKSKKRLSRYSKTRLSSTMQSSLKLSRVSPV